MPYGKYPKRGVKRPNRRRPLRGRKAVAKKAIKSAFNRRFAYAVKRVIDRVSETKLTNFVAPAKPLYTVASADWGGSVLNLVPEASGASHTMFTISQGVNQGDRIGNDIRITKCVLSGVIRCNHFYDINQNYNPCPLRVTMWIVKIKNHLTDSVTNLETIVDNTFFQLGDVSDGFVSTTVDLTRTPNTDQVTVLKKRTFYLGMGNYISGFGVNSGNNGAQQFNQDGATMSRMFRMDISKIMPKKLVFNDGTDTPSNARRLWLFFSCQRVDGTVSQTSTGSFTGPRPAFIDLSAELSYKDM